MRASRHSLIAAWTAILACFCVWISLDRILNEDSAGGAPESVHAGPMVGFKEVFMGKIILSVGNLESAAKTPGLAAAQVEPLVADQQPPVVMMCGAIMFARVGDLSRAEEALDRAIGRVKADPATAPPAFLEVAAIVREGFRDIEQPEQHLELTDAQETTLVAALGWFGELLIATGGNDPRFEASLESGAWKIVLALGGLTVFGGIALLGGLTWLIVLSVKSAGGTLAAPLGTPAHSASSLPWIFAGWFGATLVLTVGIALIASRDGRLSGAVPIVVQLAVMALPLCALLIGRQRGVSWKQVCHDVGLHCGKGFWREFFYGFTVWATAIPMVIAGALIAFILSLFVSQQFQDASHPLPEAISDGSPATRVLLLFLAAVAAPIVEEIVFRGVLFRHLRDLTSQWGRGLSFVTSALGSSFVFAAIHPQGILFIPILGALACAFCLARETRGSLISCMVAHGFHNGMIVLLIMALSS